jgi:hypothetical protein
MMDLGRLLEYHLLSILNYASSYTIYYPLLHCLLSIIYYPYILYYLQLHHLLLHISVLVRESVGVKGEEPKEGVMLTM